MVLACVLCAVAAWVAFRPRDPLLFFERPAFSPLPPPEWKYNGAPNAVWCGPGGRDWKTGCRVGEAGHPGPKNSKLLNKLRKLEQKVNKKKKQAPTPRKNGKKKSPGKVIKSSVGLGAVYKQARLLRLGNPTNGSMKWMDGESADTVNLKIGGVVNLQLNSSSSTGMIFFPNPLCPFEKTSASGTVAGAVGNVNSTGSQILYQGVDANNFVGMCSSYRVVKYDLKFRSRTATSNSAAEIIVAPFPITGACPGYSSLQNDTFNNNDSFGAWMCGIPSNQTGTQLNQFPQARRFTTFDITADYYRWTATPLDPRVLNFRPSYNGTAPTTYNILFTSSNQAGDWVDANAAGAVGGSTGQNDGMDMRGWNALYCWFDNSIGTGLANVTIEYEMILECMPPRAAYTGVQQCASGSGTGKRSFAEAVIEEAQKVFPESGKIFSGAADSMANGFADGVRTAAGSLASRYATNRLMQVVDGIVL